MVVLGAKSEPEVESKSRSCKKKDEEAPSEEARGTKRQHADSEKRETGKDCKTRRDMEGRGVRKKVDRNQKKGPGPGNPLQILAKAASLMNPKQFELPHDMTTPYSFPGTEKGTLLLLSAFIYIIFLYVF